MTNTILFFQQTPLMIQGNEEYFHGSSSKEKHSRKRVKHGKLAERSTTSQVTTSGKVSISNMRTKDEIRQNIFRETKVLTEKVEKM